MKATKSNKRDFENLFPRSLAENKLGKYINICLKELGVDKGSYNLRITTSSQKSPENIINEYGVIPEKTTNDPIGVTKKIVRDFFVKAPEWRNPNFMYNVGAAVNTPASAVYAMANDENIFNINDGLAGTAIHSEQIVANTLANLANVKKPVIGFFTFGGTATNYYATKIGIIKCEPNSRVKGVSKNIRTLITQDAHFSHRQAADWLGLGTKNVIEIRAKEDRTTDIEDLEKKLIKLIQQNKRIATIIINGGTTYNQTIDNIKEIVTLRNRVVTEFRLNYIPHIHVDSVIGWVWLAFRNYDFKTNELGIESISLLKIKRQYSKISQINLSDSWSADFHKGAGSTPIPSSIFILNNANDLDCLDKKGSDISTHVLAPEYSLSSPADFTIETSRSSGAPLSALATLQVLGIEGLRERIIRLVESTTYLRKILEKETDIEISDNKNSLGYVTMLRLYPPYLKGQDISKIESCNLLNEYINEYSQQFFSWDKQNRMDKGVGIEYSFSKNYQKNLNGINISGIKIYPTSPFFNNNIAKKAAKTIIRQKKKFDLENYNSSLSLLEKITKEVSASTGLKNFMFFGGGLIDIFINPKKKINDIDIAVEGKEKRALVINKLKKSGYIIIIDSREYIIRKNIKTTLVYAKEDDSMLDICFTDSFSDLKSPFNIEDAIYNTSEKTLSGVEQAIFNIKTKNLYHIHNSLDKENPYLLLSRMIYLMSKYEIDSRLTKNINLIKNVLKKIKEDNGKIDDRYYSCLNSFFKSIVRSNNKILFISGLEKAGVIKAIIPEISNMSKKDWLNINNLMADNKKELIRQIGKRLALNNKEQYFNKIKILSERRSWEK